MARESTIEKIESLQPGKPARSILSELYEDKGYTLEMIANASNLSLSTVSRVMHDYGIEPRATASGKTRSIIRKIEEVTGEPIKAVMHRLYIVERLGLPTIARRFGVSDTAIRSILFSEGFVLRDRREATLNRYERDGRKGS